MKCTLVLWSLFISSQAIKVISSNSSAHLPTQWGQVEILNSSLYGLGEVTVCARFTTSKFLTYSNLTYQILISYHRSWLLASFVTLPCEERYIGCTQYYKEKLGARWRHSEVLG